MGFDPAGYLAPARGAEPTLSVVPICPPPMTSYRAAFTYVLNSVTLESQLGGSFDRDPVDVRGLVAYTYLVPRRSSDHPNYLVRSFDGQVRVYI